MASEQVGLGLGYKLKSPWGRSRFPGMDQCLPVGGRRAPVEAEQCAARGVLSWGGLCGRLRCGGGETDRDTQQSRYHRTCLQP